MAYLLIYRVVQDRLFEDLSVFYTLTIKTNYSLKFRPLSSYQYYAVVLLSCLNCDVFLCVYIYKVINTIFDL